MLPNLCLLPHEAGDLDAGEPLCAPATARLDFMGEAYLARPVRFRDGRVDAVRKEADGAPLLWFSFEPLARTFERAMDKGRFYRSLFFDSNYRLMSARAPWQFRLVIHDSGEVHWHLPDGANARFKWKNSGLRARRLPSDWRRQTRDKQIEAEIQAMLANSRSDCAFAVRWIQMSQREQDALLFATTNGTLDECREVIRAVLWSDFDLKFDSSWSWNILLSAIESRTVDPISPAEIAVQSTLEDDFALFSLSPRQSRLLRLIFENFGLHFTAQFKNNYLKSALCREQSAQWNIKVLAPSAHERLEAQLRLRDWLRDKVSPDELAALMNQS